MYAFHLEFSTLVPENKLFISTSYGKISDFRTVFAGNQSVYFSESVAAICLIMRWICEFNVAIFR